MAISSDCLLDGLARRGEGGADGGVAGGLADAGVAGQKGSVHAVFLFALLKDLLQLFVLLVAALLALRLVEVLDGATTLVLGLVHLQPAGYSALSVLGALRTDDLLILQLPLP